MGAVVAIVGQALQLHGEPRRLLLQGAGKAIDDIAAHEFRTLVSEHKRQWKEMMEIAAQRGDGKAFAYIRRTQTVAVPGDIIRNKDEARSVWKDIWTGADEEGPPIEAEHLRGLRLLARRPPTPVEIRKAASLFPVNTTSADGWHPKTYQFLTDAQLLPL